MTPYQEHVAKWHFCQRCQLCKTRRQVVLMRGKVPAPILFIGEAPGASENVIGRPFVGPAGKLLDKIIAEAMPNWEFAMTNLVGCIPVENGSKLVEPPRKSIETCQERLEEAVELVNPRMVVYVGKLAAKHRVKANKYTHEVEIIHPAAILRASVVQQGLLYQRTVVELQDAINYALPNPE